MKLEGSLTMFPLRELIEMTLYSSVSGVLNIFGSQQRGQIFFRDGHPYHATSGDGETSGINAVVALFEQTEGTFAFVDDVMSEEETLLTDPLDMIEYAERMAARWRRVRHYIPDLALVPCLICDPERARYSVSPEHWSIFTSIDNQRSLRQLIDLLNFEPIEVCEAAAQMCQDKLIELRDLRSSTMKPNRDHKQQTDPSSPRSSRSSRAKAGILDRLLAQAATTAPATRGILDTPPSETSSSEAQTPASDPIRPQRATQREEDDILQLLRN